MTVTLGNAEKAIYLARNVATSESAIKKLREAEWNRFTITIKLSRDDLHDFSGSWFVGTEEMRVFLIEALERKVAAIKEEIKALGVTV